MKTPSSNGTTSTSIGQLSGFWNFAKNSLVQDKEIGLYLILSVLLLYGPLFEIFWILKNDPGYARSIGLGRITLFALGFLLYSGFVSQSLKFLLAFTGINRYRGKNPKPKEAFMFLSSVMGFIFKLTFLNFIFEVLMILIGAVIDAIFRNDHFADIAAQTILGVTEISKEIFLGLLIPLAVFQEKTDLNQLAEETQRIFRVRLQSTLKLNLKIGLISLIWISVIIATVTLTPQSLRETELFGMTIGFLFMLLIPFGHLVGICTSLAYCRIVCLSQDPSLTEPEFHRALQEIGVGSSRTH